MGTREVGRVGAKCPEKAGRVPRWCGHQGQCTALVSTVLLFFNFAAKSYFNEGLGRCPVCTTAKSQLLWLKPGYVGGQLRPPFHFHGGLWGAQVEKKLEGWQKHTGFGVT